MKVPEQARRVNWARTGRGKSLVSVCIPSYNASRYIGETIQSVLDSTHSNLEIIVNDNASTDSTRDIVKAFGDKRVHFFQNESNLGPARNWNCALEKATGELVGLLYSDDMYGPFWLTWAVHVLEKHPHVGWVGTAFGVINDKGETFRVESRFAETREYSRSEAFLCAAQLNGLGPGIIIRREILEKVGYFDEEAGVSADNDLLLRLAARYPLYYSNYPHTACRLHSDSVSHRWGVFEQIAEGLRHLNKAFSDEALPEDLRKHQRDCYTYFYHKVLAKVVKLLEQGDLETVQRLFGLLYTHGYRVEQ